MARSLPEASTATPKPSQQDVASKAHQLQAEQAGRECEGSAWQQHLHLFAVSPNALFAAPVTHADPQLLLGCCGLFQATPALHQTSHSGIQPTVYTPTQQPSLAHYRPPQMGAYSLALVDYHWPYQLDVATGSAGQQQRTSHYYDQSGSLAPVQQATGDEFVLYQPGELPMGAHSDVYGGAAHWSDAATYQDCDHQQELSPESGSRCSPHARNGTAHSPASSPSPSQSQSQSQSPAPSTSTSTSTSTSPSPSPTQTPSPASPSHSTPLSPPNSPETELAKALSSRGSSQSLRLPSTRSNEPSKLEQGLPECDQKSHESAKCQAIHLTDCTQQIATNQESVAYCYKTPSACRSLQPDLRYNSPSPYTVIAGRQYMLPPLQFVNYNQQHYGNPVLLVTYPPPHQQHYSRPQRFSSESLSMAHIYYPHPTLTDQSKAVTQQTSRTISSSAHFHNPQYPLLLQQPDYSQYPLHHLPLSPYLASQGAMRSHTSYYQQPYASYAHQHHQQQQQQHQQQHHHNRQHQRLAYGGMYDLQHHHQSMYDLNEQHEMHIPAIQNNQPDAYNQFKLGYNLVHLLPIEAKSTKTRQAYGMDKVWHDEFEQLFSQFLSHVAWFLFEVESNPSIRDSDAIIGYKGRYIVRVDEFELDETCQNDKTDCIEQSELASNTNSSDLEGSFRNASSDEKSSQSLEPEDEECESNKSETSLESRAPGSDRVNSEADSDCDSGALIDSTSGSSSGNCAEQVEEVNEADGSQVAGKATDEADGKDSYQPQKLPTRFRMFIDSAKVRFCCDTCGHGWTSMKGRVVFWYELFELVDQSNDESHEQSSGGHSNGIIGYCAYKLFGQQCDVCKIENRFERPMWYPEEVTKVLNNLYNKIGQIYFGFKMPAIDKQRRAGKPKTSHNSSLCQACHDGVCTDRK